MKTNWSPQLCYEDQLEELTSKEFWMKARIFITFNLGIHIPPFCFKHLFYLLKITTSHLSKLHIRLLFYCTNQSEIPTYSNVIVNQLIDKNQKNKKKKYKRQKHSGSLCIKSPMKTFKLSTFYGCIKSFFKDKMKKECRKTHHINIHDLRIVLIWQKHIGSWCIKSRMKNSELISNPLPMDMSYFND